MTLFKEMHNFQVDFKRGGGGILREPRSWWRINIQEAPVQPPAPISKSCSFTLTSRTPGLNCGHRSRRPRETARMSVRGSEGVFRQ
ncbi:hypothetical protein AAFF_G00230930 [Aldrovandia affinis]|uniref:Uncharacterized protein n=1 Tax=Aldrovandia affinis TaxID=143900 RepID=A0AAD7RFL2_9TELE|nr:hypothetical protein AAFF_G00230930 [Aldrovandia affinis]